jgi:hypothetical protein
MTDTDHTALPVTRRIPLSQRVGNVEQGLLRVETKIDEFHLNGSGVAIKALAEASGDLVELARCAPALIAIASERTDAAAFWRTLQRWVRWGKGTKALVQTIVAAAAGAAAYYVAAHIWGLPGGH